MSMRVIVSRLSMCVSVIVAMIPDWNFCFVCLGDGVPEVINCYCVVIIDRCHNSSLCACAGLIIVLCIV